MGLQVGVCRQTIDRNNPVHSVLWLPGSEGKSIHYWDITSEGIISRSLYVCGRYSNCEAGERVLLEMCPCSFDECPQDLTGKVSF